MQLHHHDIIPRPLTAKLTSVDSSNFLALDIFLKEADLFLMATEPVRERSYTVLGRERGGEGRQRGRGRGRGEGEGEGEGDGE